MYLYESVYNEKENLINFVPDYRDHDWLRWYCPTNVDGKNSRLVFQRVRHIVFRTSSRKYIPLRTYE